MPGKSKIIAGLKDAVRYSRGDLTRGKSTRVTVPHPLDVKAIRTRQGLTQEAFAKKYGFSLSTLRNWEQGHRAPTGASRVLLLVIEKQPQAVEAALVA
jgi:putative transcriptional regulator